MNTTTTTLYRTDRIFAASARYRRAHKSLADARRRCDRSEAPCSIEYSRDAGKTWTTTLTEV